MDDVRGDFLGPPHGTTPAAVIANKVTVKSVSFLFCKETPSVVHFDKIIGIFRITSVLQLPG